MSRLMLPVSDHDHIQGPDNAAVTVVEYGDYECPHCGKAHYIVKAIQRHLGNQMRFVFRNFPLTQIHPNAQHAAEAAEAAGTQGRFWEMHDMLFEHQNALDDVYLLVYATALGLDKEQFEQDMRFHTYAERVREDFLSGVRSGVNGTPTFFINGERHEGSWDVETLTRAILGNVGAGVR